MLRRLWRGCVFSSQGLTDTYRGELSFRMEVWSGSLYVLFGYWFWPLLRWEILLLALSFLLILMAELVNTAIERALERLHPERHELIGLSKDAASAAVFVAILFGFVVVGSVVIHRL